MKDLADILESIVVYLRNFDGSYPKFYDVVLLTENLEQDLSNCPSNLSCGYFDRSVPDSFMAHVRAKLTFRAWVSRSKHVQVILFQPVHYLVAFLHLKNCRKIKVDGIKRPRRLSIYSSILLTVFI